MKQRAVISLFLCCCLLLTGCGFTQGGADTSGEGTELPFSLELPEGTEVGECWENAYTKESRWLIESDRLGVLGKNTYPEADSHRTNGWDSAGWIILNADGGSLNGTGAPYLKGNRKGFDDWGYERREFGWLCVMECHPYTDTEIETYDIPEALQLVYFWCVAIPNESNTHSYHWLGFNQLCFTEEEVIAIAESFSMN